MDIIGAMIFTILKFMGYIIETALTIAAIGLIMLGIAAAWMYYTRRQNDTDIDEDVLEESLACDDESRRLWRELDRLNDEKILENTKDL